MYSFGDNDNQEDNNYFTLRLKESKNNTPSKTLSTICHPLIYSMRNDTIKKSHNDFKTKFDICYDDTSIDPPNIYLTDYARAIAICEDFFINTPLKKYMPEQYKCLLLEKIKNEVIPSFDSALLTQIEKFIDYYLMKEKIRLERIAFSSRDNNNSDIIRNKMTNLKEEIAIMDLDHGYDHFSIRKRKIRHQKILRNWIKSNSISVSSFDENKNNNDIKKPSKSIENNVLIKKILEKYFIEKKCLSRNYSQPLIDIQKKSDIKGSSSIMPKIDNQTTTSANPYHGIPNKTNTALNGNIIPNIFTSIYKNTPKLYLNKRKLSDIENTERSTNINQKSLLNHKSFNKSTNSLQITNTKKPNTNAIMNNRSYLMNEISKLSEIEKYPSFVNHPNDRYKLTPNLSIPNLNSKDNNHLVSTLRSTTTNNTITFIKGDNNKSIINTSKRRNSKSRNYSKETDEYLVKTSLIAMKQYQNSLRSDTFVSNYKPKSKSTRMKPIPIPMNKQKKIIPYVYQINKQPIMHLKDYSIKLKMPMNSNHNNINDDRDHGCNDIKNKLKKMFNSFYTKLNHNTLLLLLLKTSAIYNKEIKKQCEIKGKQNNKSLQRNISSSIIKSNGNSNSNSRVNQEPRSTNRILMKDKDSRNHKCLKNNKSLNCLTSTEKKKKKNIIRTNK